MRAESFDGCFVFVQPPDIDTLRTRFAGSSQCASHLIRISARRESLLHFGLIDDSSPSMRNDFLSSLTLKVLDRAD